MIALQCQCCKIIKTFADNEAAFQAGWDAPPHFSMHICCDLCPAVCVVLGAGHEKAHAHWAQHGRPEKFGPLCVTDKDFGETTEKDLKDQESAVRELFANILKESK